MMITREQMVEVANRFCDCTVCPQYGDYCAYVCEINDFIYSLPDKDLSFTNEYLNIPVNESKLISYLRIYHGGY